MKLMPHAVEDAEADGQADTQNPAKIPHPGLPSIKVGVGVDVAQRDAAEQDLVDPGGVEQDDRQEDHRHGQHDEQRI